MRTSSVLLVAMCLFVVGCDDSKVPLSDAKTSKPDDRLIGVWRDADTYYYIGRAGEKFPKSVLRIIGVELSGGKLEAPEEYLAFPTVLGNKTYLNLIEDTGQTVSKQVDKKGWDKIEIDKYSFFKYQFDGDKLMAWMVDDTVKKKMIRSGKIKGETSSDAPAYFTDTMENVARLVAEAGDDLLDLKEVATLERVVVPQKPEYGSNEIIAVQ